MTIIELNNNYNKLSDIEFVDNIKEYINDKFKKTILTENVFLNNSEFKTKIINAHKHPLINSLYIAYSQHVPIALSPNDIWQCIAQSLADYINENTKQFETKYNLSTKNKINISVERPFFPHSNNNNWVNVFPEFAEKIKQIIKDDELNELILDNFSTSTTITNAISQLTLMDACKQFFKYTVMPILGCGAAYLTKRK